MLDIKFFPVLAVSRQIPYRAEAPANASAADESKDAQVRPQGAELVRDNSAAEDESARILAKNEVLDGKRMKNATQSSPLKVSASSGTHQLKIMLPTKRQSVSKSFTVKPGQVLKSDTISIPTAGFSGIFCPSPYL